MAPRQAIKLIAFDLGGVLVEIDKSHIEDAFFEDSLFHKLMLGEIPTDAYFLAVGAKTQKKSSELQEAFQGMVKPYAFCIDLIGSLKAPFSLWSNINPCHFEQIAKQCGILKTHSATNSLSFETGLAKPSFAFFNRSLQLAQVQPCEIIFFDDKSENIIAAKTFGIRAHLVQNPSQIQRHLQAANLIRS